MPGHCRLFLRNNDSLFSSSTEHSLTLDSRLPRGRRGEVCRRNKSSMCSNRWACSTSSESDRVPDRTDPSSPCPPTQTPEYPQCRHVSADTRPFHTACSRHMLSFYSAMPFCTKKVRRKTGGSLLSTAETVRKP